MGTNETLVKSPPQAGEVPDRAEGAEFDVVRDVEDSHRPLRRAPPRLRRRL